MLPPYPSSNERLLYLATLVSKDYRTSSEEEQVATLAAANLVSFLTESGTHEPAIDFDLPAAAVRTSHGVDIWVDTKMHRHLHRHLLQTMSALGLLAPSRPLSWKAVRLVTIDFSDRLEVIRTIGPEASFGFKGLLHLAHHTTPEKTGPGPAMSHPCCLPFNCEATLIPSTNNNHLYLDAPLAWTDYRCLLEALVRAHIVEPGYLEASDFRQQTYLRLPWVKKSALLGR